MNYNGWRDTQECLESILKLQNSNYQIIVIDNNSPNNSMDHLLAWASGKEFSIVDNARLGHLSTPRITKPVDFLIYDKQLALQGGCAAEEVKLINPIIFIQLDENNGFSSGNNVGIQYALSKEDAEYIWLLNNDTVVNPDTAEELSKKASYYKDKGQKVGLIGAKLMYYHQPEMIQAVGGKYNKWLSISTHIGSFEKDFGQFDSEDIVKNTSYPIGASMFVDINFIKDVGLMCEDYFLFFEELDWTIRGKKKGWEIGYSWSAVIYHKEAASTGMSNKYSKKSDFADYLLIKNRLIFTRKFYPWLMFIIRLSFIIIIINRFKRKQFYKIPTIIRLMFGPVFVNYSKLRKENKKYFKKLKIK